MAIEVAIYHKSGNDLTSTPRLSTPSLSFLSPLLSFSLLRSLSIFSQSPSLQLGIHGAALASLGFWVLPLTE